MTVDVDSLPDGLAATVEAHGKAVAAGDNRSVLADFLPDRIGQLIASADVPTALKGAQVRTINDVGDGRYDAVIRYSKPDDEWFELRSRWVRFEDGSWRVLSVRNIPATAPWMDVTGPGEDGLDGPHWDALCEGVLKIQRCGQCHHWIWSPRPICPSCHSLDTRWEAVAPVGTVYSWTRTWQPFTPESTGHLPYVVVLVELPGADGARVVGVLADADDVTPTIGAPVRGSIEFPPDEQHWPLLRWHLENTLS
ncbi:OB-fold domain-containing protein [Mycolicibacterium septicum]|uniref:Zn-ribbon domain-containing OB-fold protein n=1 Tax=Mycolicibacterium septicum TaxID=98668 RepID=UPI0023E2515C|nr:OB-fold domain-containing protein [Mycolicibacterium septicum]MDF3337496.1 OB-fold domain-containing protein [Mycolicibacterium septicum]